MKLLLALFALLPCCALSEDTPLLGAPEEYDVPLANPLVQLGVKAINDMYKNQGDNNLRSLVAIIKGTKQMVAGFKYAFTLEVTGGLTNEFCDVDILFVPWLNSDEMTSVTNGPTCHPVPKLHRRAAGIPGGATEVQLSEDGVQEALNHLQRRVNEMHNGLYFWKGGKPGKITQQVVNGLKFVFTDVPFYRTDCSKADGDVNVNKDCTAGTQLKSVCSGEVFVSSGPHPTYTVSNEICAHQPSARQMGGQIEQFNVDVNDFRVGYAVKALNQYFDDGENRLPVAVLFASRQVVSGMIYNFTLKVASSDATEICNIAIWSQPWLTDPAERIKIEGPVQCEQRVPKPHRRAAGIPGGATEVQLSDDGVQEALNHLQRRVNDMSNGLFLWQGGQPGKITRQVVNGLIFVFTDVPFYRTDCQKADRYVNVTKICTPENQVISVCSGEVYVSSGPHPTYTVSNEICAQQPSAREMTGQIEQFNVDVNDFRVGYAVKALNQYFDDGENRLPVEVLFASRQVVSGMIYNFTLRVASGVATEICNIAIWSQPWFTDPAERIKIEGPVQCEQRVAKPHRRAAGIPGGATEVQLNDDGVQEALNHLQRRINEMSNGLFLWKGGQPGKITRQVVNGLIFVFTDVPFYKTDCQKADGDVNVNKDCTAGNQVKSVCSGEVFVSSGPHPSYTVSNEICAHQPSAREMTGQIEQFNVDVNDFRVGYAVKALNQYFDDGENRLPVEVLFASRQVVSGMIYNFTLRVASGVATEICNIAIWSQPWLTDPAERIKIEGPVQCEQRVPKPHRRAAGIPGGATEVQLSDDGVQEALNHLQRRINEMSNALNLWKGGQPGKITKQVVNGLKFVFTDVPFYRTDCLKGDGDVNVNKDCTVGNHVQSVCSGEVFISSGPHPTYTVSNEICAHGQRRRAVGGPQKVQLSDDGVHEAFNYFQRRVNELQSLPNYAKAGQPAKITEQVVNGLKYVFTDVPFYKTDCSKADGDVNVNKDCTAESHVQFVCSGDVLVSSGPRPTYFLSNKICARIPNLVRRSREIIAGGVTDVDLQLDDANVVYALGAINKHFQSKGDNSARTPVKLIKSTVQVVAGALYTFTIQVSGGPSAEMCDVEVWFRPWVPEQRETKRVSCNPIVGGHNTINTDIQDPMVRFAEGAINNMYQSQGDNAQRTVVEVLSSSSQVVAGVNYDFNLKITGGPQPEKCHIVLWDRPWLGETERTQVSSETPITCTPL